MAEKFQITDASPGAGARGGTYRQAPAEGEVAFTMVRRWYSPVFVFTAIFCVFWDGFLVAWYGAAVDTHWIAMLFPIGHVGVGVALTYGTIAGFLNRTTIAVRGGVLTVRHGPVPWWGNQTLAVDDLVQLYCKEKVTRGNDRTSALSAAARTNGPSVSYEVHALLRDGRHVRLLSGLPDADQARFVAHELESRLALSLS